MRNLYTETLEILQRNGKNESDIRWVGSKSQYISSFDWLRLKEIFDIDYDGDEYGSEYINKDLLVVGDDWWLERHDYDGNEWWEFKTLPPKPNTATDDIYDMINS